MGTRGPKPTPTATLNARGSWRGKIRPDAIDPLFPVEVPSCPKWLNKEAKAEWRRVVKLLLDARVISKVSRAALAAYCSCWARWVQAEAKVQELGPVLTSDAGNLYRNPWYDVANGARTEMVRLSAEFGMTPSSAARITPGAPEPEAPDPMGKARFFQARNEADTR